jgi:hypothetical protein
LAVIAGTRKSSIERNRKMKKWYQSKLIWLGTVQVLTAIGSAISSGADWKTVVMAALGVAVVYLRDITTKAIGGE